MDKLALIVTYVPVCQVALKRSAVFRPFVDPTDRQSVASVLIKLGRRWTEMASFFGYTRTDLEGILGTGTVRQQIATFLKIFQMPHCGEASESILDKALCVCGTKPLKKSQSDTWGEFRESNYG